MKQYESYKDSGIEWLGEIPSHWGISKLKHHTKIVLGKMLMSFPPKGQEDDYTLEKYLKSRNIGWLEVFTKDDDVEEMWFNQAEKELYELKPNDIVMNEGGDIGKVAMWQEQSYKCYIQNSVNKLTANDDLNPKYLVYLIYSISRTNYFWSVANPVSIAHLTKEKLSETPIIIPTLEEQNCIASYLDDKVSQIDAVITEKEKMVEDLQNYRKSVISEAVTRGLNPDAPMKDSGIEWIGMIPEHWIVSKLKAFADVQTGSTPSTSVDKYWENPAEDWYTPSDFEDSDIQLKPSSRKLATIAFKEEACRVFDANTVFIVGIGATLGKVGISSKSSSANQQINAVTFKEKVLPLFGAYYLYSIKDTMKAVANAATLAIMNQSTTKDLPFICPPFEEQRSIVKAIDNKISVITNVVSELQSQIEDLKSYKSSLITEAVTGKIDLR